MFKKLYKKYFQVSKTEKISDLTYSTRITFSLLMIFLCLFSLCSTTFAFFTASITSSNNTISSASAFTTIRHKNVDESIIVDNGSNYVTSLAHNDLYEFEIDASSSETETCYVKITLSYFDEHGNEVINDYFTTQLFKVENAEEAKASKMTIGIIAKKDVTISFETRWGTSKHYIQDTNIVLYEDEDVIEHSHTPYIEYTLVENETFDDLLNRLENDAEKRLDLMESILLFNNRDASSIQSGTTLKLPYISGVNAYVEEVETETYIVKEGDSLESIATTYEISVEELLLLNEGLEKTELTIGSVIYVPVLEVCVHAFVMDQESKVEATCTSLGSFKETCSKCGEIKTSTIDMLEHTWIVDETTRIDASCTNEGSYVQNCHCGASETVKVPALDHDMKETIIEPTCSEKGSLIKTCTNCGASESSEIAALGHDFVEISRIDATSESEGSYTEECRRCKMQQSFTLSKLTS